MQQPVNWGVGQTTLLTIVCMKDNKTPLDLTGLTTANLQFLIHPSSGADVVGGGTFTIVSATQGLVQYLPVAADFATPGSVQVFVVANFTNVATPSDPIPFTVVAR